MSQSVRKRLTPAAAVHRRSRVIACLPLVLLPVAGLLLFVAGGRDDAYITFWAGEALARFGHIVNYNGEFLEQSSSLAQVVLLGALARIVPLPVSELGIASAVLFGCASVWVTGLLGREVSAASAAPARWLAATAAGLVYWSFGGLETSMATFAYGAVALVLTRMVAFGLTPARSVAATLLCALLATVRPEGAILGAAVLAGLWCWTLWPPPSSPGGRPTRALAFVSVVLLLMTGALAAWRHWYTGAWFAQPVIAKAGSLSLAKLTDGVRYLATGGVRIDGMVWLVAGAAASYWLLSAARRRPVEPVVMVASLFTLAGYAFIVLNGGDWMEGHRFMVPFLPTAVVLLVHVALTAGGMRLLRGGIILQLAGTLWLAHGQSSGTPLWAGGQPEVPGSTWFERRQRINYRDTVFSLALLDTVRAVRSEGRPRPVVMSIQMGLASYKLASADFGHVRFVDLMSLTTRDFTECRLTSHLPHTGHGLEVDYAFYFQHRAELLESCGVPEPDIIFDVDKSDWRQADVVAGAGYRLVYRQRGIIASGSRLLPGMDVPGEEFIAVRPELAVASQPDRHFDASHP